MSNSETGEDPGRATPWFIGTFGQKPLRNGRKRQETPLRTHLRKVPTLRRNRLKTSKTVRNCQKVKKRGEVRGGRGQPNSETGGERAHTGPPKPDILDKMVIIWE